MPHRLLRPLALLLIVVASAAGQHPPHLAYTVEVRGEDRSAFHYALDVERPGVDEVVLSVAAWAPGSYRLMNAADGIKDVAATDETGAAREVSHDGALTWRVKSAGAASLRVTWRFTKLTAAKDNRSFMAKTSALLDGPRNYLYWRDRKDLPAHVSFKVPDGWTVATGLTPTFDPATFVAKDADFLLDCPVLMGVLEERRFVVRGVPHRVVVDFGGRPTKVDLDAFADCCRRCVVAAADIMGGLPYDHYSFLFAGQGGGLEHLTSTTIGVSAAALERNPNAHQGVIAHEHFHAWNVKRLRPAALGPFDYDGPVRTKSLWFAEGVTNYYTEVVLARAGLVSEAEAIDGVRGLIGAHVRNEASRVISPEENSWTVWDGPYLGGPISYYDQGQILGLLMDLEIRGRTHDAKSLDDAMRLLYRRFSGARGFQSEDLVTGIYDATGVDLHDFFLRHVSGAQEPDWGRYFRRAGLIAKSEEIGAPALSFTTEAAGEGGVRVKDLREGSAAARLGLKSGDVVRAIDGAPTEGGGLARALRELRAGAEVTFDVLRDGKATKVAGKVEAASDLGRLRFVRGAPTLAEPTPGSGLAQAGLRAGDVVTSVGGRAVSDPREIRALLSDVPVGATTKVGLRRDGGERVVEVRAEPYRTRVFTLEVDPAATEAEVRLRKSWFYGPSGAPPAASRPATTPR